MVNFQASVEVCHVHNLAQAHPCNAMHYTSNIDNHLCYDRHLDDLSQDKPHRGQVITILKTVISYHRRWGNWARSSLVVIHLFAACYSLLIFVECLLIFVECLLIFAECLFIFVECLLIFAECLFIFVECLLIFVEYLIIFVECLFIFAECFSFL